MIVIDGSLGEGGGQILRSALSLSACTGQPFRIKNIRANRARPGLMRQHLTCVRAAEAVCHGKSTNASVGSTEITFSPGEIASGSFDFNIGTAGSTSLVFQTILPILLAGDQLSHVVFGGGTHNPDCPPFEFIDEVFAPMLSRIGARIELNLERRGFYPAGGGRWYAQISPLFEPKAFQLTTDRAVPRVSVEAATANLPGSIAERELAVAHKALGLDSDETLKQRSYESDGPGNVILIRIDWGERREIITGFGKHGVSAETVSKRACNAAKTHIEKGGVIGEHLADQLLLPLALAAGGSFETVEPSLHFASSVDVIKTFLDVEINVERIDQYRHFVKIERKPLPS